MDNVIRIVSKFDDEVINFAGRMIIFGRLLACLVQYKWWFSRGPYYGRTKKNFFFVKSNKIMI